MSPLSLVPFLFVVPLTNPPSVVNPADVDTLWEFVQTLGGRKAPPPLVYFTSEAEPAVSSQFLAFYYEHTRVLRISPLAVRHGLYDANAAGYPPRLVSTGYVYLVLGHEMLHYALAERVPVEEHHCLFAREGYRKRIAEFLVQKEIGHPFLRAMGEDPDGCDPLRAGVSLAFDHP